MPDQSDPTQPPLRRDVLVIDGGGADIPPDIRAMVDELAGELGAEVIEGSIIECQSCRFFECVCEIRKIHKETCKFRLAMECHISLSCAHGEDVCATCNACDCGGIQ